MPIGTRAESGNFDTLSIDADAGTNFSVSVNVSDLQDATTVEAVLEYDPDVLTFISAEADDDSVMAPLFELGIIYATNQEGDTEKMSVSVPSASATNGSGELVKVIFKLADDASGSTNISLDSLVAYKEDFSSINASLGGDLVVTVTNPNPTAPLRTNASPSGTLDHNTTQTDISLTTDVNANCRYSTDSNISFDNQTLFSTTGGTEHSQTVTGLASGNSYNYYVKCRDESGTTNTSDYLISFIVDLPPVVIPPSGGGGGGGSYTPPSPPVIEDPVEPIKISEVNAVRKDGKVTLTWVNPEDDNFDKVIIVKSVLKLEDDTLIKRAQGLAETIYEGTAETFIDTNIIDKMDYYYLIYAIDKDGNSDLPVLTKVDRVVSPDLPNNIENGTSFALGKNGLFDASSEIVEKVTGDEASRIMNITSRVNLNKVTASIYDRVVNQKIIKGKNVRYRIAYFIHYGTETSKFLGAGERGGVLDSYYSAFAKMPETKSEWKDIIKIANGRWPSERNIDLEEKNKINIFNKIYKRIANMDTPSDNAAVTVITYGLRPLNRNINSEKVAIKFFRSIFKHNPSDAIDWDIVRAIAYSGAIR